MEKKKVKRERVYYMDYIWHGKWQRSKEYTGLVSFVAACGAWCDKNPDLYRIHWRDRYVDAM